MIGETSNPQGAKLPLPPSAPMPEAEDLLATMRFQASQHSLPLPSFEVTSPSRQSPAVRGKWHVHALRVGHAVRHAASRAQSLPASITRAHASMACAVVGAALVAASVVAGWSSVSAPELDKLGPIGAAVILARAAMAIATMITGGSLLKMSERLSASNGGR